MHVVHVVCVCVFVCLCACVFVSLCLVLRVCGGRVLAVFAVWVLGFPVEGYRVQRLDLFTHGCFEAELVQALHIVASQAFT